MALDTSALVKVSASIAAGGVPRLSFGRGLLVTEDDTLPPAGSGKAKLYTDLTTVGDDFGSSSDVYGDAQVWFGADPAAQGLYVGRWQRTDIDTELRGTAVPSSQAFNAAPFNATNGSFVLNGIDVTGIDLSSATTGDAIATAIQTAIRAAGSGTPLPFAAWTFSYDAPSRSFTLGTDSTAPITGDGLSDTSASTDTDLATALGMAAGTAGIHFPGTDAETIVEAVEAMIAVAAGGDPVAVMLASDASLTYTHGGVTGLDSRNELAAWAQADKVAVFALRDNADTVLDATDTTSHVSLALAASQGYVQAVYDDADNRPDIGAMALLSAQDLSQPASIITQHSKSLPNVTPADIGPADLNVLKTKRCSVYATVGGTPAFLGGYASRGGHWMDAVWFLLWQQTEIQRTIWRAERGSRRFGPALLQDALNEALQRGVDNGGLQPGGTVEPSVAADIRATLNTDFDGVLAAGYLSWVDLTPSAQDREDRNTPFKAWVVGTPATHEVVGSVVFTN